MPGRRAWLGLVAGVGLVLLAWLPGCGPVYDTEPQVKSTAAKKASAHADLHVHAFRDYVPAGVLEDYLREYGVSIQLTEYARNADLEEDLQQGRLFDLVMPSNYLIEELMEKHLLARLNLKNLPNLAHLDRTIYSSGSDPQHEFSVPYLWATMGIAYNADRVPSIPRAWADLFHATNDLFKGQIVIYNDTRYALGCALLFLKYSPNTVDPAEVHQAVRMFTDLQPYIKGFENRQTITLLAKGDSLLALASSPDAARAMADNPAVRFIVPEDTIVQGKGWVIPATSRKQTEAEHFLNYLLRPEVSARISNASAYASANKDARAFVDRALINGPAYERPAPGHEHHIKYRGPAADEVYERAWQEVLQRR